MTIGTYRAETRHHIRLGASRDGKLTALLHEGWEVTSRADAYKVAGTDASSRMYACPNVWTKVNLVQTNRNTPGFMRSPPEVPHIYALECATDELGVALKMHEIGTGAYTVIAQAAATRLGVPIENVAVELGDSALPPVTVAGGSHSTASVTMAVAKACDAIRAKLSTGSLGIGGVDLAEAF